jgi:two-component SAPR family response regulator
MQKQRQEEIMKNVQLKSELSKLKKEIENIKENERLRLRQSNNAMRLQQDKYTNENKMFLRLDKQLKDEPLNAKLHIKVAHKYLQAGKYHKAHKLYYRAKKLDPSLEPKVNNYLEQIEILKTMETN